MPWADEDGKKSSSSGSCVGSCAVVRSGEVRLVLQCSVGCIAPCQALMVNGGGNLEFGFVTVFVMTNLIACID